MRHRIIIRISLLMAFLFGMIFGTALNAQNETPSIKGVVHNEFGKPLAGVMINSEKGKDHAFTDEKGEYSIVVNDGSNCLVFSFTGYVNKKVSVGEINHIDVNLKSDVSNPDEVIQLGYSSQSRDELTGSVSTVSGDELEKSPVSNLSMTFDGRLPGLFTQETSSELSRANTNLYVRGQAEQPLVVIDGIPTSYNTNETLDYISPNEIQSITLLKDAATEALYGIQGSNGVLVITTKRGQTGKLKVNARVDESVQQVTTKPTFINSAEYATLRNEAAENDGLGQNYFYSNQQIAAFKSGTNPTLYPNTNWYNLFMKPAAQMQRVDVNMNGGTDQVKYFTDINVMNQGSQFKTDNPGYNSNEHFTWANFRSNVDAKINSYLSGHLDLTGNVKNERTPGNLDFSQTIYQNIFLIPSAVYGPVTPSYIDPTTKQQTGDQVISTNLADSPYGMLNRSGYTNDVVTNIYAHFGLDLDMSFLTKGLKASGTVAYQTNTIDFLYNKQDYERVVRTNAPDTLAFTQKGGDTNTPLSYSKSSSYYYYLSYNAIMSYDRNFGLSHVSGMGYTYYQKLQSSATTSPGLIPYTRLHTGLEASYDYNKKYILRFDMGYSGSDSYAPGNRFTTTPAISAGWVASRESFLKDINWLNNLKLRASYGKTANDQGVNRFAYLDNDTWNGGGPIGSLQYTVNEGQIGNPNIKPEISTKQNYGIDLGFFNQLSVGLDVFRERCDNMLINATGDIPTFQGVPLSNYPTINGGIVENMGYDFTANYTKAITKDLTVFVGGFLSYAKNWVIYSAEPLKSSDYAYRKWTEGFSVGQQFGYLVDYSKGGNGFFNSQSDITNSKLSYAFGTPRVGDLKYKDVNHDGVIDQRDEVPLGTGSMPRYYYGISGGLSYKSFDLSFLFQGIGEYKTVESGWGIYGTDYDGIFGSLLENAYTPTRFANGEKITAPALSLTTTTNQQPSDYYLYNRAYLRLKNLEIGYTLPNKVAKAISANKIRFTLSAQNLVTWDKMKSNDYGPEGGYGTIPVYRVYNVGLSLLF